MYLHDLIPSQFDIYFAYVLSIKNRSTMLQ